MEAYLFNVQRFSTRDGPGIRTTAFFQGCNLRCPWCHNPESVSQEPKLQFFEDKCVSCGGCVSACGKGAHTMEGGKHRFDESLCVYCGTCALYCPKNALRCDARLHTPETLSNLLLRDLSYYQNSGGGVTASGGEPMLRADFIRALFSLLKEKGVHTAIDTAANVSWSEFEKVLPVTDLFLVDLKAIDAGTHKQYTGADNAQILRNIRLLSECGAGLEVRMPLIRGVNDSDEFAQRTAAFLTSLPSAPPVRLLAYHNYGLYKAESVRLEMREFQPPESVEEFANILKAHHIHVEVS
jgi:pyruvate formate lyase activating enzyme